MTSISPSTPRRPTGSNCRSTFSPPCCADPSLAGWDGFGLAVQAYQKRARAVIDWVEARPKRIDRRLMVRLVKGAYWDTEIKRAQEHGLADYPVFTRKAATDLCYRRLRAQAAGGAAAALPAIRHPQRADRRHASSSDAGGVEGFEFQRLHGMGEGLYGALLRRPAGARLPHLCAGRRPSRPARLSGAAAAGERRQHVLRLAVADRDVPVDELLTPPAAQIGARKRARASGIPLPGDLYAPARRKRRASSRRPRGARRAVGAVAAAPQAGDAAPLIDGATQAGAAASSRRRSTAHRRQAVARLTTPIALAVDGGARRLSPPGTATPVERARAAARTGSRSMESERGALIGAAAAEGGKTLDDAVAEVREAVDFCRYYAAQARASSPREALPGPTGESNALRLSRPRRLRLHQPVELPAGDLHRPGRGGARWPAMRWSPSRPSRRR